MTDKPEGFDCPQCGAPISLEKAPAASVRCPHCGTTVIVPDALRERARPTSVVIRIQTDGETRAAAARAGRGIVVAVVALSAVAAAIVVAGLVLGIGAAVGSTVLPAVLEGPELQPMLSFGGEGIGAGRFTDARSIGLDAEGRIYVGEYQGGRIQAFDPDGTFLTQWFVDREFPLTGMAVRRDGVVYTVQRGRIVLRDGMNGVEIGSVDYDEGDHFEDVALLADGGLLAAWYRNRDDLVVFDRAGQVVLVIEEAVSGQTGDSELSLRVAADGRGDLLALGGFNDAVFRYDAGGHFVNRFGSAGDEPGQFRATLSLAVDGQGRVYVGDAWGVEVFERDGRFVQRVEVEGPPYGLTLDDDGRLWVVNGTQVRQYGLE
jgi:DNA-directed RNA polymerase subunit RPC12/RpoP